ncbi:hypothetical protein AGDE_15930 [Angomonas deanei]|nr:hypothetical protein AGDE_15930 [Angomonas deanei]|eukprot:EPY18140.1 hypothetical protein AGDE_15930 [Angomonas deanei]
MQLMWNDATGGIPSLRSHLYYELAGNGMLVDYHTYENLKTKREEEQYLRRLFDHKREQQMKRWERRFKNSKSTRDRSAAYLMNESGNRTNSAAATRRWGDVTGSSLFYRHFMFVTLSYLHRFQVFLISVATGAALLCLIMTTLHFGVTSDNNDSYDGTYSRVVLYTLLTYRFDTAFFMIVFLLMIIIQLMPMSCGFADRHWRVHRLRQQAQLTAHPYHTQNNNNNRQGKGLASATTLMDVRQTQMENYIHATELSRPRYREEKEEEEDNNGDEAGIKRAKKENNNNAMNQNAIIKDANYCVEPTTALRMSAAGFRLHQKQKIERELRNEGDMGDIPFLPDEDQINRNNNNERKLSMSPGNDLFNNTNNSNSHTNNNNNNRLLSVPTTTLGSEHSSTTFPFNSSQNSNNNNVYSNSISNASRYGSEAIFHPYDTYRGNEKNDHNMNPNNHNNTNNSTLVEIGASHHGNRHKVNNAFAFQSISSLWVHDKLSANNLFTKVFFDLENWFARHLLFFHRLNKINNSLYQTTLDKAQQKNQKKERENMNFLYYYVEGVYTLFSPSFWLMLVLFAFTFFEMQLLTGRTDAEIMSWENNNIEKKLYTIYILRAVILLIVWVLFLFF